MTQEPTSSNAIVDSMTTGMRDEVLLYGGVEGGDATAVRLSQGRLMIDTGLVPVLWVIAGVLCAEFLLKVITIWARWYQLGRNR